MPHTFGETPEDPVRRPTWTEEDDTEDEFPELLD